MRFIGEGALGEALPRLRRDPIFADLLAVRYLAPSPEERQYEIRAPTSSTSPLIDALDALAGLLPSEECDVEADAWRLHHCQHRLTERAIHSYFFPFSPGGQPASKNTAWRPGDYNRSGLQRRFKAESRAPHLRGWLEYHEKGGGDWHLELAPDYVQHAAERLLRGRPIWIWDFVAWALRYCPIPHEDSAQALTWARDTALFQFRIPGSAVARDERDAGARGAWFYHGDPPSVESYLAENRLTADRLVDIVVAADLAAGGGTPDSFPALRRAIEHGGVNLTNSSAADFNRDGAIEVQSTPDHPIQDENGIELETSSSGLIARPFDPTLIRVEAKPLTLDLLIRRIRLGELDLTPGFQRNEVWKPEAQSRLIESILIRIPLPAFYFDARDDDRWIVVDGLQRLTTLKKFVIDETLKLSGLEFLTDLDGCRYGQLPRNLQRRIDETQITAYLIEEGTPPEVKFNVFKRINTGGLPLSSQEIRHALNQGPATKLLEVLASSLEFKAATGNSIRSLRMEDRELVLRFLALAVAPRTSYTAQDLDTVLNEALSRLNRLSVAELADLDRRFRRAMEAAQAIFGKHTFRKFRSPRDPRSPINRALFEGWSTNLDRLTDADLRTVIRRKDRIIGGAIELMSHDEFYSAISHSTGDPSSVRVRDEAIRNLVEEVLIAR